MGEGGGRLCNINQFLFLVQKKLVLVLCHNVAVFLVISIVQSASVLVAPAVLAELDAIADRAVLKMREYDFPLVNLSSLCSSLPRNSLLHSVAHSPTLVLSP